MRLTAGRILRTLIARGIAENTIADAGRCMARGYVGRGEWTSYHDRAPEGASYCRVCGRLVLRGFGAWWDIP